MRNSQNVNEGNPVGAGQLDWKANEGAAEISDFGPHFRFHQVYKDACDEGMSVYNPRTGRTVTFAVTKYEKDREGEITAWHLTSLGRNGRTDDQFRLTIFND